MEAKPNYKAVGITVLVLSTAFTLFALWLSVGFTQKKYHTYVVYVREPVTGLNEESQVKYNGVTVGLVRKIELNQEDPRQVRLILSIEDKTPITEYTSATLISQGITGTSFVGLSASSDKLTPLKAIPGEPYPIIPSKPSLFNQFDKALKEVSVNINLVSKEIRRIFDKENANHLKKILTNVEEITQTVNQNNQHIQNVLKGGDALVKQLSEGTKELPEVMRNLNKNLAHLNILLSDASNASLSIKKTMDTGRQSIQQFTWQLMPPAIRSMQRVDNITLNLEQLSRTLKENPSSVIRGVAPPPSGPGE